MSSYFKDYLILQAAYLNEAIHVWKVCLEVYKACKSFGSWSSTAHVIFGGADIAIKIWDSYAPPCILLTPSLGGYTVIIQHFK